MTDHDTSAQTEPQAVKRGTVLVVGGTSDIGRAVASAYAAKGWSVTLTARDMPEGERNVADLVTRHPDAQITLRPLDILDTEASEAFIDGLPAWPDTVVCVVGMLGDQSRAQDEADHATQVMRTNFEAPALLLEKLATRMNARGGGLIVGVSSVAGDRGRATNYVYGAAKAGFTAYLSGLRNRYASGGLRVTTLKPGFVRTKMTADMDLPNALTTTPETVAARVFALQDRPADVVYVLRRWRLVMLVIRAIPEAIFKKMKF